MLLATAPLQAKCPQRSDEASRNTIVKKVEKSEYWIPNRYKIPRRKPYTRSLLNPDRPGPSPARLLLPHPSSPIHSKSFAQLPRAFSDERETMKKGGSTVNIYMGQTLRRIYTEQIPNKVCNGVMSHSTPTFSSTLESFPNQPFFQNLLPSGFAFPTHAKWNHPASS